MSALAIGASAPAFELPGVDGVARSIASFSEPALLVVFTCNHCPISIAYEDRLIELARDYVGRCAVVAINPNDATRYSEDSFEKMKERAAQKRFRFPYLRDESQAIARAYGAQCTPDPFLFDRGRKLVYAGRIDDSARDASRVTRRDLRTAIEAVLTGRAIELDVKPATGCSIKWRA